MSQHPFRFRKTLLTFVALSSTALAACVAEVPARPGVDYGYVAGTYGSAPAQTPYAAAPYDAPYSDPYYDSYYGYNSPYYGGAYYGNGYYYGPSTTFVYTRNGYSPGYGYRSRGNSYRDDRSPNSGNHDSGDHNWRNHAGNDAPRGDGGYRGGRGNGNHNQPGRPNERPGPSNASPHQDDHPRPVMGNSRPVLGGALSGGRRAERSAPTRAPAQPDSRRPSRERD